MTHVVHPIAPVFSENSEILILGSFPSVKSREEGFFYGHPQNRFWRVLAGVYCEDTPESVEDKKAFLLRHRLSVWDVLCSCEIKGSSDASIINAVPNDISVILKKAPVKKVLLNGKTAQKYYDKYLRKNVSCEAVTLPSTSPANAAWSYDRLLCEWKKEIENIKS